MAAKIILDDAHHYLQKYCVIEVTTILFFCVLTAWELKMFFTHLDKLSEWAVAGCVSFNASSVGVIKYCLDSINIDYKAGKSE